MRILLTADAELPVPPPLYGGIERVIDVLIGEYLAAGHEIGLVGHPESTSKTTAFFPWPGRTSTGASDLLRNADMLRKAANEFNPDVIHSFSRLLWLFPLALDRRPKVMSYQREPTGRTVRWSNIVHRGRLQFTGCSEYICHNGRRRGGGEWTSIPNAVDLNRYHFQPHVASNAPLVFLSRIESIKGCHAAIQVAKQTGRRLLIAGNHSDHGEAGEYWHSRILPEIGRNGIEYVGPVNDLQKNDLLGRAAGMLVPIEWNEPFGIVFVEALACGTPVISCPRGALPEIVREGIDGFLVEGIEAATAAVEKLSSLNRHDCRRRAEDVFSGPTMARQYLALYANSERRQ